MTSTRGQSHDIPSSKLTKLWKITIFNGKTHYKWPCSIAMLVYQRVLTNYQLLQPTMNFQSTIVWFRIGAEKSTIMQIGYIHLNHHSLMDFYHMTYI